MAESNMRQRSHALLGLLGARFFRKSIIGLVLVGSLSGDAFLQQKYSLGLH